MREEYKQLAKKIKPYHIILLGVILSPIIIINSNYANKQRAEEKLYKEKSRLFNKIILGRNLEGEEDTKSKTDEICDKGSDELKQYYKTGNLEEIDLKSGKITCEEKDKDYIKALINILKSKFQEEDDDAEEEGNGRRNLNTEEGNSEEGEDDDIKNDAITYGKHLIPILVFLVVAILCIPGWLMCCFCCCCNCCCCCCCKKPCCKIPCFVITFALYALVVAVCFYGLSQSNHIFVGIADTECSILRFVDEVIDGETKETLPKWAGSEGIKEILQDLKTTINAMGTNTVTELEAQIKLIDNDDATNPGKKQIFLGKLKEYGDNFYTGGSYHDDYTKTYTDEGISGKYALDLVKSFGKYNPTDKVGEPEESFIYAWVTEYKIVSETADNHMTSAVNGFTEILGNQLSTINSALDEGINSIDNIASSIEDIKESISDIIVDNSGTIDEYGNLGVKAVFGVLALINVAIAVFMLLLCFCSGKCCTKCCCCRCICKLFTHLLWNILALLMIIVFLIGFLFALIGKVGEDAMSIISFLVSDDNLGEDKETILLGSVKDYLGVCINGNGQLEDEFGFSTDSLEYLDDIKYAQGNLTNAKNEFQSRLQMVTYTNIINELQERKDYISSSFSLLVDDDSDNNPLNLVALLRSINEHSTTTENKEEWTLDCTSTTTCGSGGDDDTTSLPHDEEICFQPKYCLPYNRDWIQTSSISDIITSAQIITDMNSFIETAYKTVSVGSDYRYFKESVDDLGAKYRAFLNQYIIALTKFNDTIDSLTNTLNRYTGENAGIFSFINCNFIGKNIKVILKYLKDILGGDVYTIGVCLILVGCSLALSISFTIFLIIVINADIDNNKKKNNNPPYELNAGGRVIQYK